MFKNFTLASILSIIIIGLFVGVIFVYANWAAPISSPPTCVAGNPGCDAPINVSNSTQTINNGTKTIQTKASDGTIGGGILELVGVLKVKGLGIFDSEVIVGNSGDQCPSSYYDNKGAIRYNSVFKILEYCDSISWKPIATSSIVSTCVASCGACPVSCGGGIQTCTSASCSIYTQSCNTQACAVPAPTLSISASPSSEVSYNSFSIVTWSTTNATTCTASGSWSGNKATSGSETMLNLQSDKTYTLQCNGSGGNITKSATVTVASPWVQKGGSLGANLRDLQSWNGRLYAAGGTGVWYWSGSSWVNATTTLAISIEIWNGELCVGFWGDGVRCYNGSSWTSTLRPNGYISDLELWESSFGDRLCADVFSSISNINIACYDGVSWIDIESNIFTLRDLENWVIGSSRRLCYSNDSNIRCNDGSGFSNFTGSYFNELNVWNNMLCGIGPSKVWCYSSIGTFNRLSDSYGGQAATVWGSRLCVDKSNNEISCYDSTWTDYGIILLGGSITDVEVWNSTICVSGSFGGVYCYEP